MRLKQDKIEYNENEIEAQGCWSDCYIRDEKYKNNGEASEPVGGSAITRKCGTFPVYSPKTNPFL
ncbi:MAG: hypothetical protein HFH68_06655 [Lachnospiraceae bacterium]|nr:hypothetical protein [Lachnospiraceae bacterium]